MCACLSPPPHLSLSKKKNKKILSFDGSETLLKFALHPTNGFSPGYSGFPIRRQGCLELEAFFLFQGRINFVVFLLMNAYSKAQHACSLSSPPHLSLSLFCSISVLCHIIFITSHLLYVIVMPTIFQASNKRQKLNQNKIRFLSLSLFFF